MTLLFCDIETLPTTDMEVIAEIAASIKPPGTIKKPESVAAWMAENKDSAIAEAVHKTGLSGLYGRIACICYAFDDGPVHSIGGEFDEVALLNDFYRAIEEEARISLALGRSAQQEIIFVGHNIIGFDLPFIKHRSIILGVKPPLAVRKAFDAKAWGSEVADTMLMWSSDKEKRASMDKLCWAFGIPGKGGFDGSMVADTWPVDPQKVIDYCKDDVTRTRQMYKRLMFLPHAVETVKMAA